MGTKQFSGSKDHGRRSETTASELLDDPGTPSSSGLTPTGFSARPLHLTQWGTCHSDRSLSIERPVSAVGFHRKSER